LWGVRGGEGEVALEKPTLTEVLKVFELTIGLTNFEWGWGPLDSPASESVPDRQPELCGCWGG
jgi:hypothetical protein